MRDQRIRQDFMSRSELHRRNSKKSRVDPLRSGFDPSTFRVVTETDSNSDPSGRTVTRKPLTCSLPEAAARMGVRVAWLQEKVKLEEVPFTRIGKASVGFTDQQIADTIDALTVTPKRDPKSLTSSRAKKRAA